jgi:hypothetical protein
MDRFDGAQAFGYGRKALIIGVLWTFLFFVVLFLIVAGLPKAKTVVEIAVLMLFSAAALYLMYVAIYLVTNFRPIIITSNGIRSAKNFLRWSDIDRIEVERTTPFAYSNLAVFTYSIVGRDKRIRFSRFIRRLGDLVKILNEYADRHQVTIVQRDFGRDSLRTAFSRTVDRSERRKLYRNGIYTRLERIPITDR